VAKIQVLPVVPPFIASLSSDQKFNSILIMLLNTERATVLSALYILFWEMKSLAGFINVA